MDRKGNTNTTNTLEIRIKEEIEKGAANCNHIGKQPFTTKEEDSMNIKQRFKHKQMFLKYVNKMKRTQKHYAINNNA